MKIIEMYYVYLKRNSNDKKTMYNNAKIRPLRF